MAGEPEDFILDLRFRKCAFFLVRGRKTAGGKVPRKLCGTCFAVSMNLTGGSPTNGGSPSIDYVVTAAHVIFGTLADEELYIRVNRTDGEPYDIPAPRSTWEFHPTSDVAACAVNWPEDVSLDAISIPVDKLPTPEAPMRSVCEGEEVTVVGLLTPFAGDKRIQPIVRFGRIALMPHEQMLVDRRDKTAKMDAYLIEMLAYPGMSGSPVIVYPHRNPVNRRSFDHMIPFYLLGLVHGQIDLELDVKFSREKSTVRLGSGISVVIPGEAIYEVLMNNPAFSLQRVELLEQLESNKVPPATPMSVEDQPTFTQQDFEADLMRVTRRVGSSEPDEETK